MRFVITGATGYIGGRVASLLVERSHEVYAVVRPTANTTSLESLIGMNRVLRDDGVSLDELLGDVRPDAALHIAANQEQRDSEETLARLIEANIMFGTRFARACAAARTPAFVWADTFSVHRGGTAAFEPATPYAATKQAFADMLAYYADAYGMPCVALELTDTFGPADPRRKVLDLVAKAAADDVVMPLTPGEQLMSLVHVDDVAEAFLHAATGLVCGDIAPGRYAVARELLTLREIVAVWERATGWSVKAEWGARPYGSEQVMRPFLAPRLPGWSPRVGLHEGFAAVYGGER